MGLLQAGPQQIQQLWQSVVEVPGRLIRELIQGREMRQVTRDLAVPPRWRVLARHTKRLDKGPDRQGRVEHDPRPVRMSGSVRQG
ncbi:hypothetical protein CH063_12217, partial [Colletotrichum higginsianum]